MRRILVVLAFAWTLPASIAGAQSPPVVSFEQRLASARADLAVADAKRPPQPAEQTSAIERLFELLDEATALESDEAQKLAARDLALRPVSNGAIANALALERSARVMFARRELERALSTVQSALDIVQRADGDKRDAQAAIHATLGIILANQYKYAEAIAHLEPAVAGFHAHGAADARQVFALQQLALAYEKLGKKDLAQTTLDRANAAATALEGSEGGLVALGLSIAAGFQDEAGNYAAALDKHERALALLRNARPPRPALYSAARVRYAWTLLTSGAIDRAARVFLEDIAEEEPHPTFGGATLASAYYGYGYCLRFQEQYEESAGYLRRALTLAKKIYGEDADGTAFVEKVLAQDLRDVGRFDEAIPLLQHVIAVTDRAPAGSYAGGTSVRPILGDIYVWQGRYAEAEPLFRATLARIGLGHDIGSSHPRGALEGLAVSLWAQGRDAEAFEAAVATERSRQKMLRTAGADLGEQHGVNLKQFQRGGLDWVVAIAAKSAKPDQVREAWDLALESQGLISTISARRLAVARAASDPKLVAVWKKWKDSDEAFVQARVEAARDPSLTTSNALDAAEQRFDDIERELAHAIGASGAALEHARLGIAPVLAALPNDTLLASYIDANSSEPADLDRPSAKRHGRLYVFTARRGAKPQLIDLGPRTPIESAVKDWLALVTNRNADAAQRDAAGHHVRELIWDPIAKHWPQKRVFIVPSVQVERIPFPAFPVDGKYLIETGYTFHLLDHERDVLAPPPSRGQSTLALIGAPDFSVDARTADSGTRNVCAGLRGAFFTALPQAEREIEDLRSLWSQRSDAVAPMVLTGADATEAHARAALGKNKIVHFATHGLYLGAECGAGPGDARGLKNVDTRKTSADVPDISALVLSGANRPATDTENDGLLTSEEIAALDLSDTDWAVLSACDTGIGKNVRGEGVFGLRRAFRLAGAHTVIMSLWPVSDSASADWMLALYRARLQQHATTIDAVRTAGLALIKQRREAGLDAAPYYWAAFTAAGDWR